MVKKFISASLCLILCCLLPAVSAASGAAVVHPVESLVGEKLSYDISFLWFRQLAEGTIRLERGERPGTYLAIMEARTRGFAAFVTSNRIEKYQTLMEIGPSGRLRPIEHSSHTFKGKGKEQKEKKTSYRFDYQAGQVNYTKVKHQRVDTEEQFPLDSTPVYDILSAFYNLRLGAFGALENGAIHIPSLHRQEVEEIIVAPISDLKGKNKSFFAASNMVCKVLVDPSVFKTNGRELFVHFDKDNRLERGIIKNVIGLGDVEGVLR